jgi:hypothetical protein
VFDGEVSRAWCAFVEGLVGLQSIVGVAEQVDFDGEGVAVADGGAVEMFVLRFVRGSQRVLPLNSSPCRSTSYRKV